MMTRKKNTPKECLQEIRILAENKNGKLLSNEWPGVGGKLLCEYENGEQFSISYRQIKRRGWPKNLEQFLKDSNKHSKSTDDLLNELRQIAEDNGGELLSQKWEGNLAKYQFKKNGITFERSAHNLKQQGWPIDQNKYLNKLTNGYDEFLNISNVFQPKKKKTPTELLEEIRQLAEDNGAELVSQNWINARTPYTFKKNGKQFQISANNLKTRGWPKDDSRTFKSDKDYINELREIAENNNGELLSEIWAGDNKKYRFKFNDGRTFEKDANTLKNKGWPSNPDEFLKTGEDFLKEMKQIAEDNNGELLSQKWEGNHNKYSFKYNDGRVFSIRYWNLVLEGWPEENSRIFKTNEGYLNELKKIAEDNNGKLLSKDWEGAHNLYLFKYQDGRTFQKSGAKLKADGWPTELTLDRMLRTDDYYLNKMNEIALERGGKLISNEWLGNDKKYEFADDDRNIFEVQYQSLLDGQWTPDRGLVSEPICRQVLNYIFGFNFEKTNKILTAKLLNRSRSLELDGYCKELNIAFEYQGHQSHWNKNYPNYLNTKTKDNLKKAYCKKLGILLIEIPKLPEVKDKWDSAFALNHVLEAVVSAYVNNGIEIPQLKIKGFKIDFSKINYSKEKLKELNQIAEDNDGKLLSKTWIGSGSNYLFESSNGIVFERTAAYLKNKGWPQDFSKLRKIIK